MMKSNLALKKTWCSFVQPKALILPVMLYIFTSSKNPSHIDDKTSKNFRLLRIESRGNTKRCSILGTVISHFKIPCGLFTQVNQLHCIIILVINILDA